MSKYLLLSTGIAFFLYLYRIKKSQEAQKQVNFEDLKSLRNAVIEQVLHQDADEKLIYLLISIPDRGKAIVSLSKTVFAAGSSNASTSTSTTSSTFPSSALSELINHCELVKAHNNDRYYQYHGYVPALLNPLKVDITYPITDQDVKRFAPQETYMIRETGDLYKKITGPYIRSLPKSKVTWVYNILEKKKEVERLMFEDPHPETGFMISPDPKWDQKDIKDLYCLVLCHRRDLYSLRDLTAEHLPLLTNIRDKGSKAIAEKYNVPYRHLRIYLHYLPTYFHLHFHFTSVNSFPQGTEVERAHLLETVIDNIQRDANYYQNCNLSYTLATFHPLSQLYLKHTSSSD